VAGLVLEPLEVAGPLRWRWLLRTEEGEALASHQVALPAGDYEHRGFTDLYRFLRWQADPDRRVVSEAQLTAQVGDWIGRQALGEPVLAALLDEAPVTVRVPVPAELAFLPYRPWEIAAGGGLVLGREQVRFVFDLAGTRRPPRRAAAPNGRRPGAVRPVHLRHGRPLEPAPGPRRHPEKRRARRSGTRRPRRPADLIHPRGGRKRPGECGDLPPCSGISTPDGSDVAQLTCDGSVSPVADQWPSWAFP